MNPYMCDFDYLADLSDDWESQCQAKSVNDNSLALLREMQCTNMDYRRRTLDSEIQVNQNRILELQNQIAINQTLQCLNTLPTKPAAYPYGLSWCDCARAADGRIIREVIEVTSIGDNGKRYIQGVGLNSEDVISAVWGERKNNQSKPKIELKENQIIRDDWLIQQYPYPECGMTLELVIAYAGELNEQKVTAIEPLERFVCERKQASDIKKPWFVRFALFLNRIFDLVNITKWLS